MTSSAQNGNEYGENGKKSKNVPIAAREAFAKAFPDALKAKWEKETEGYEVNFVQAGQEMSAVYSSGGVLKETEKAIRVQDLPVAATDYLAEHYKGSAISEAAKITKANGAVNFEAEVNSRDMLFDASGKFLSATHAGR